MNKLKDIVYAVGILCVAFLLWIWVLPVSILGFMLALTKLSFEVGYNYVLSGNFQNFLNTLTLRVERIKQNWRNK